MSEDKNPYSLQDAINPDHPLHYLGAWAKRVGVKQVQLAEGLGYSASHMSEIIKGQKPLALKSLHKASDLLGVPAGYILQYHPDNVPDDIIEMWSTVPENRRDEVRRFIQVVKESALNSK